MHVRNTVADDFPEWSRMRTLLWPDTLDQHRSEIDAYFNGSALDIVEVFVLDRANRNLGGFIELNLRNFAEGSYNPMVPYIEGWFVDADLRGLGFERRLVQAAEKWALKNGYTELASDAEIANRASIAAHLKLSFTEVERVVCILKKLK